MVRGIFLFFLVLAIGHAVPCVAGSRTVLASYYGQGLEGNLMANGQRFRAKDPTTAAHKTLPMGTRLLVKNKEKNRKLIVVVKDRGPFRKGRSLDLSYAAAKRLGYVSRGVARLEVSIISD